MSEIENYFENTPKDAFTILFEEIKALREEVKSLKASPTQEPKEEVTRPIKEDDWVPGSVALKELGFTDLRQLKTFCNRNNIRAKRIRGTKPFYPIAQIRKAKKNPL